MVVTNLQTVLKLLPDLKPHEQIEVRKRLDFLTQSNPFQAKKSAREEWLEDCVTEELLRRGITFGSDCKGRLPKGYWQESEAVRKFLLKAIDKPLSTAEKYALGRVTARALADYLENTPGFGLKVMFQQINKVPQALDASFPGYIADGMLGMLVKVRGK